MGLMPLLALDTSLAACSVALWRENALVAERWEPMSKGHAEALVPMIQDVCARGDVALNEIGAFAVTCGPGTFTGIRVGLATARGLALIHRRPIVGLSTLAVIAATAVIGDGAPVLVVQDARRGEVYAERIGDPRGPLLLRRDDLAGAFTERPLRIVGSAAREAADRLGSGTTVAAAEILPRAAAAARLAAAALAADGPEPYRTPPTPLYLRAPDAKLPPS